ncbi:MAG: hypothetical protein IJ193_02575, partial [Bacilli bacterium]|nr:hypothetical protein [Bacilli bacterium]
INDIDRSPVSEIIKENPVPTTEEGDSYYDDSSEFDDEDEEDDEDIDFDGNFDEDEDDFEEGADL